MSNFVCGVIRSCGRRHLDSSYARSYTYVIEGSGKTNGGSQDGANSCTWQTQRSAVGNSFCVNSPSSMRASQSKAQETCLLIRPPKIVAWLALIAVVAGFLTASADAFLHHAEHYAEIPAQTCDAGAPLSHLVRGQAVQKIPPCSACFLRSLVAHSLIPQTDQYVPAIPSAPFYIEHRIHASRYLCSFEVNRGPPSMDSIES